MAGRPQFLRRGPCLTAPWMPKTKCAIVAIVLVMVAQHFARQLWFELYASQKGWLPCYEPEETLQRVTYVVHACSQVFTELNVTHWLDYGTLLGAYRYGHVIPWDYDGDISYLDADLRRVNADQVFERRLRERYNITIQILPEVDNQAVMVVNGTFPRIDLFPWKQVDDRMTRTDRESTRWDFPASLVQGFQRLPFGGRRLPCPKDTLGFIKMRYPRSWNRVVQFKLDCWMPHNWFRRPRPPDPPPV